MAGTLRKTGQKRIAKEISEATEGLSYGRMSDLANPRHEPKDLECGGELMNGEHDMRS